MAFTIDLTEDVGIVMPFDGHDKHFVIKKVVDFSVYSLDNAGTIGLIPIPAGVLVREVLMKITTSADSDCTDVNIGKYSTAGVVVSSGNQFMDAANPYSATVPAYVRDVAGQTYSITDGSAGFVDSADWVIGLSCEDSQSLDNGVIEFYAICVDLN